VEELMNKLKKVAPAAKTGGARLPNKAAVKGAGGKLKKLAKGMNPANDIDDKLIKQIISRKMGR
jgi:hypothetical protein